MNLFEGRAFSLSFQSLHDNRLQRRWSRAKTTREKDQNLIVEEEDFSRKNGGVLE